MNRFYALRSRGDQGDSPNVFTGMLQVFSINIFALLNPGVTLSFVTPLVAIKFGVLPDILIDIFRLLPQWGTQLLLEESI